MCIIFVSNQEGASRPTLDELKRGARVNDDGAGIAWLEHGSVRWRKGVKLTPEEIFDISSKAVGPVLIHLRWTSSGTTRDSLCHPFPVGDGYDMDAKEGEAERIFMHNGTVDDKTWKALLLQKTDLCKLPKGPWSDSRALAYMIGQVGDAFLSLLEFGNRFVTLSKDGNIEAWGNWNDERAGLWTSCPIPSGGAGQLYFCGSSTTGYRTDSQVGTGSYATGRYSRTHRDWEVDQWRKWKEENWDAYGDNDEGWEKLLAEEEAAEAEVDAMMAEDLGLNADELTDGELQASGMDHYQQQALIEEAIEREIEEAQGTHTPT